MVSVIAFFKQWKDSITLFIYQNYIMSHDNDDGNEVQSEGKYNLYMTHFSKPK